MTVNHGFPTTQNGRALVGGAVLQEGLTLFRAGPFLISAFLWVSIIWSFARPTMLQTKLLRISVSISPPY
eukprot:189897-Amphidinium_carterae.1